MIKEKKNLKKLRINFSNTSTNISTFKIFVKSINEHKALILIYLGLNGLKSKKYKIF